MLQLCLVNNSFQQIMKNPKTCSRKKSYVQGHLSCGCVAKKNSLSLTNIDLLIARVSTPRTDTGLKSAMDTLTGNIRNCNLYLLQCIHQQSFIICSGTLQHMASHYLSHMFYIVHVG